MDVLCFFWTVIFEMNIQIWFIESSGNTTTTTSLECEKERNGGCCDGYYRDHEGQNCTKCSPGYSGPNCTIQCPYPSYGENCQGYCNCDNDACDISTGCTFLTTDELTSFPLTREPTNVYNNTTFYTLEFSSSTVSDTTNDTTSITDNGILITLIKIFGGVDILLIFIYTIIFVIDRQREKSAYHTENTASYTTRNNSIYENVEIDFFT